MNEKLSLFKKSLNNKKITVIGIGVSNVPLIKFLIDNGAIVKALDKKSETELSYEMQCLKGYDVEFVLGEDYLENIDGEVVFKTPGMRFDVPQLVSAREKGSLVTSEMEVFFELCPCKIIAVTGSDGKTTTTTLISEILKKSGKKVWVGGNIGNPLVDRLEEIKEEDIAVLELSSFQLHTMKQSPIVAVFTNLSPNHLDVHKSFEEYMDAKKNIFLFQNDTGKLVLNADNEYTASFEKEAVGEAVMFSRLKKTDGVYLDGDEIICNGKCVLKASDIKIPGIHNVENYMAAIGAVYGIATEESIEFVAKNFNGVEHRIELVRTLGGVKYYNDSIASSPTRTEAGLRSFKEKPILIAGGYDKHIPFDDFGKVLKEKVSKLILMGDTKEKIKNTALDAGFNESDITIVSSMKEAVEKAKSLAKEGDIVLMSPACASFDMYKNFMLRGDDFKNIVNSL